MLRKSKKRLQRLVTSNTQKKTHHIAVGRVVRDVGRRCAGSLALLCKFFFSSRVFFMKTKKNSSFLHNVCDFSLFFSPFSFRSHKWAKTRRTALSCPSPLAPLLSRQQNREKKKKKIAATPTACMHATCTKPIKHKRKKEINESKTPSNKWKKEKEKKKRTCSSTSSGTYWSCLSSS